ncbi:putative outer membrane protein [Nonlabens ulvanivorans]|nr:putative outer membrane protein [Nonlabens ulvanivorans]
MLILTDCKTSSILLFLMKHSFFLFLLLYCTTCVAQRTITGNVSDTDGEAILGVTIAIKDSAIGAVSDFDGNYSIVASIEDVLVFSYPGYITQEKVVRNNIQINVILNIDPDIESITYSCFQRFYRNTAYLQHGVHNGMTGVLFESSGDILPIKWDSYFSINYLTDFETSNYLNIKNRKNSKLGKKFYFSNSFEYESTRLDNFQYDSYELSFNKSILISKKDKYHYLNMDIIAGYIDYHSDMSSCSFGYGIGLGKEIFDRFYLGTNFIHWNEFNEYNVEAIYSTNRFRFIANYRNINQFKDLQIGLGYRFHL